MATGFNMAFLLGVVVSCIFSLAVGFFMGFLIGRSSKSLPRRNDRNW